MMAGNVWTVEYDGEGADMVKRDLEKFGPIVRCGGAGAIWRATIIVTSGRTIRVELYPINAHTVAPTVMVTEILRPHRVIS